MLLWSKLMEPRSPQEVEDIARECSLSAQKGEFAIVYTTHARERMELRNISEKEVESVLEFGKIQNGKERWNDKQQEYSYLIRDKNLNERDVTLAIGISEGKEENKVIIVTAELITPQTGSYL